MQPRLAKAQRAHHTQPFPDARNSACNSCWKQVNGCGRLRRARRSTCGLPAPPEASPAGPEAL
eukprot:scaffold24654_cov101-Isochrysis_galbana.AAC.4